nr:hypothetical protein [uncultured Anaeromusa sp.]
MRLEIGKKVGVITGGGIVFGTVDFIYPYGEIRVAGSWNGDFCEAPAQYVFPVWEWRYTKKDVFKFSNKLRDLGFLQLCTDLRMMHQVTDFYTLRTVQQVFLFREAVMKDLEPVADYLKLLPYMDKFLEWANHGFPNAKEAMT